MVQLKKIFLLAIIVFFTACANRSGGPQGGPRDITPPTPKKSNPANNAKNFKGNRIDIDFDEFVTIKNPMEGVIISPIQTSPPTIRNNGKRVTVILNDTLQPNTSYTLDFGNSITDLNESNPISDYLFSFSTGPVLDTLQISGTVLDAASLNPVSGQTVGIYPVGVDSVFTKTVPLRIAKTDQNGRFTIKNVSVGEYRIFSLADVGNDYLYNNPAERISFLEETIKPSVTDTTIVDTLKITDPKNKTKKPVDSLLTRTQTRFLPDNIVLRSFKKESYAQQIKKFERPEAYKVSFFFATENKEKPSIKPINFEQSAIKGFIYSTKMDSITCWIADSATYAMDTLKFEVAYRPSDTIEIKIDTINTIFRTKQLTEKEKKKKEKEKPVIEYLKFSSNIQNPMDVYKPIRFSFGVPIEEMDKNGICLLSKRDTVWKQIPPLDIKALDSLNINFEVDFAYNPNDDYKFMIDSATVTSIYGKVNDRQTTDFSIKGAERYATLIVSFIQNTPPNAVIELLNDKDAVVTKKTADAEGATFEYLTPGEYYLRLFIDKNGNGVWDTGDYETSTQPEAVYYLEQPLNLRANWELEQEWDYLATPAERQKPAVLKKEVKN
jgi:hypothetical protein